MPIYRMPANDIRDSRRQALSRVDVASEIGLKQAENRIVREKGRDGGGARWMLRRLRMRLFGGRP
jgi:hypothetical protein